MRKGVEVQPREKLIRFITPKNGAILSRDVMIMIIIIPIMIVININKKQWCTLLLDCQMTIITAMINCSRENETN